MRALLVLICLLSLPLSWLAAKRERIRQRQRLAFAIGDLGGRVFYDDEFATLDKYDDEVTKLSFRAPPSSDDFWTVVTRRESRIAGVMFWGYPSEPWERLKELPSVDEFRNDSFVDWAGWSHSITIKWNRDITDLDVENLRSCLQGIRQTTSAQELAWLDGTWKVAYVSDLLNNRSRLGWTWRVSNGRLTITDNDGRVRSYKVQIDPHRRWKWIDLIELDVAGDKIIKGIADMWIQLDARTNCPRPPRSIRLQFAEPGKPRPVDFNPDAVPPVTVICKQS